RNTTRDSPGSPKRGSNRPKGWGVFGGGKGQVEHTHGGTVVPKGTPLDHARRELRRKPRFPSRAVARVVVGVAPHEVGRHVVAPALARRQAVYGCRRGNQQRLGRDEAHLGHRWRFLSGFSVSWMTRFR